jgi:hypothetical protein
MPGCLLCELSIGWSLPKRPGHGVTEGETQEIVTRVYVTFGLDCAGGSSDMAIHLTTHSVLIFPIAYAISTHDLLRIYPSLSPTYNDLHVAYSDRYSIY